VTLKTHKPSGVVPWPFILLEGAEKSGKSWMAAEFTGSDRVGRAFWIEIGSEGVAEQYGAIPGADYEIVEHNGTRQGIATVIAEIREVAQAALDAGEPPVVVVVDTATAVWDLYKDWADQRAKSSKYGRKLLESDPNAEVPVDRQHWTYVTDSYYEQFVEPLKRFPGIAIVTARGKEVSATDDKGKPVPNSKEYKVEGQKNIAFDAHAWLRLSRSGPPTVVGMRSVKNPIKPGKDKPVQDHSLTLEKLVFDVLGCDPATAEKVATPVRSELDTAKALVWDLASNGMKWTIDELSQAFRTETGNDLANGTVQELNDFADFLRLCLAQPAPAEAGAQP
jgi:hypothetical protein